MKKILILLTSILLISCDNTANQHPLSVQGKITSVQSIDNHTVITVIFEDYIEGSPYGAELITFIGSDTCKVGQILNLK